MRENKREQSISMARANILVMLISIPVAILQFGIFSMLHGISGFRTTWNFAFLVVMVLFGVVLHELTHGSHG